MMINLLAMMDLVSKWQIDVMEQFNVMMPLMKRIADMWFPHWVSTSSNLHLPQKATNLTQNTFSFPVFSGNILEIFLTYFIDVLYVHEHENKIKFSYKMKKHWHNGHLTFKDLKKEKGNSST